MSIAFQVGRLEVGTSDQLYNRLFTLGDTGDPAQANMVDATGDYVIRPPSNTIITRICGCVTKNGNFDLDKYGNDELATGITITAKDSGDNVIHTFNPLPISRLWHWSMLMSRDFDQVANGVIPLRWTIAKTGRPAIFNGFLGEYMCINIPVPLTGIDFHFLQAQGFELNAGRLA